VLIRNPPVDLTPRMLMLGTSEYPLFLYRGGERCTIFEGGVGAMGPVLARQLDERGIDPAGVGQAVITHAHPDHVMAVPAFRAMFPSVRVLASEGAAQTLAAAKAIGFFRQVDETLTGSLLKAGRIGPDDRPPPMDEDRIAVDRTLREGDRIEVDEAAAFAVLETPGHSECSLSFHEPGDGILVVSDATGYYMPEHDAWWPNYFTGYAPYLDSMRRLMALGAEVLCLSHNAAVKGADDVRAYFEGAVAATEAYHERILEQAKAGRPVRQIAEELGAEVYEKTPLLPLDFFQKNCGLLVKQSLRHAGVTPAT
jgi:glyoxylase-like metal-dependent hydrolase (beta-lactamase superfamily II)